MTDEDNQKTYTITIQNAPEKSQYSLFINGFVGQVAGGTVTKEDYSFKVPDQYQGEGKIKFLVPTRTRTFSNIFFSVPINANGKDLVVDVSEYYPIASTPVTNRTIEEKKILQNELSEQIQERKEEIKKTETEETVDEITTAQEESPVSEKKFLQNELREKIQQNAQENESKKSFWDKLK